MRSAAPGKWFNENGFREVLTESDPGIADLTDQTWMTADKSNALLLAQAHLAEAVNHIRMGGELLDAHHRASFHLRQWTGRRFPAAIRRAGFGSTRFLHGGKTNSAKWQ